MSNDSSYSDIDETASSINTNSLSIMTDDTDIQELWFDFEDAIADFENIIKEYNRSINTLRSILKQLSDTTETSISTVLYELHRKSVIDIQEGDEMTFGKRLLEFIKIQHSY